MSTSSEVRRRTEAALVRAIDIDPDSSAAGTHAALRVFVDLLADEGQLPEAVVIAFKHVLARSESLHRLESEAREEARAALVSACIERYFTRRSLADVPIARAPTLRLVRDDEPPRRQEPPEASA